MAAHMPLPALLSQLLIAFTIEFDNEFEHRMPHRTASSSSAGGRHGPWLVSMAMWSNFLRDLGPDGAPLRDVATQVQLTNLAGLERWGYARVEPDPADPRPRPPRADWLVRPTAAGRRAQEVWRPLAAEIEARWHDRFGAGDMAALRASLSSVLAQEPVDLPRHLPVLRYGLRTELPHPTAESDGREQVAGESPGDSDLDLSVLLARVLLLFALEFERATGLSLAICANVIRVLEPVPLPVRGLPARSGISKEAISMCLGYLEKVGLVARMPDPATGRGAVVALTAAGVRAQIEYVRLVEAIEARWQERFGRASIVRLRAVLEAIAGRREGDRPVLAAGLGPYPEGWRARMPYRAQTNLVLADPQGHLPHYPMVLHRGGYPDGS